MRSDTRHRNRKPDEYRTPFEQDRDRVLYSTAFRRLAGITQVAAVHEARLLHNRLTHSLKVAQIGRRLVQLLRHDEGQRDLAEHLDLNPDVVETAGLAHDLGHPPFGHVGEHTLDELTRAIGGFEGNAQTFRILTRLGARRDHGWGLDLTRATLNAVLKYPLLRDGTPPPHDPTLPWTHRGGMSKRGVYQSEADDFHFARQLSGHDGPSAEAILMDWSDDISYALHDLDDYYRANLIPLHNLRSDKEEFLDWLEERHRPPRKEQFSKSRCSSAYDRLTGRLESVGVVDPYRGTLEDREKLQDVVSASITAFVRAVTLQPELPYVTIAEDAQYEVLVLKDLTAFYVIESPPLSVVQVGHRRIVKELYTELNGWLSDNPRARRVPAELKSIYAVAEADGATRSTTDTTDALVARSVCDYIASLTERQAQDLHARIRGDLDRSIFGVWF